MIALPSRLFLALHKPFVTVGVGRGETEVGAQAMSGFSDGCEYTADVSARETEATLLEIAFGPSSVVKEPTMPLLRSLDVDKHSNSRGCGQHHHLLIQRCRRANLVLMLAKKNLAFSHSCSCLRGRSSCLRGRSGKARNLARRRFAIWRAVGDSKWRSCSTGAVLPISNGTGPRYVVEPGQSAV